MPKMLHYGATHYGNATQNGENRFTFFFIKSKFELQNFLPSASIERFLYYLVLSSRCGKLVSEISLHLVTDSS